MTITQSSHGILSPNAVHILEKRYLLKNEKGELIETPEQMFRRVAKAVAKAEAQYGATEKEVQEWEDKFFEMMWGLRFMPNSPTLVGAGTDKACLSACFVISPEDTMESIMQTAFDAAMIEKWGGGIGFGFSKLRPKGDKISTTHGKALGPLATMKIYSAIGETITQGSFRLGAHMGQLIDNHPDIMEFIHYKDNVKADNGISNFNISVQMTDAFIEAVKNDADWDLINPRDNKVWQTIKAKQLWREVCESAWKTGDPGIAFIDRVWETQPNPQLGYITTSNPCQEEWLENYGSCNLGSINLYQYVIKDDFDWVGLELVVCNGVRFLDDVVTVNQFPLPKLREVNLATRRIGLGVMGWADALVALGVPYDSDEALLWAEKVSSFINTMAWKESAKLAKERGPFLEYDNSALKKWGYPPVRNSSVTNVAPTGSISRLVDSSSGIEPYFSLAWYSNILWEDQKGKSSQLVDVPIMIRNLLSNKIRDGQELDEVLASLVGDPSLGRKIIESYGIDTRMLRTTNEIAPEWHVKMQSIWARNVSNSVSKTCNLPPTATVEDVEKIYLLAHELKCKGITIYRAGSREKEVLVSTNGSSQSNITTNTTPLKVDGVVYTNGSNNGKSWSRPKILPGETTKVSTGHGNVYVTVNYNSMNREQPLEVLAEIGKAGGCENASTEAIGRLISLSLQNHIPVDAIVSQLKGITCCPTWHDGQLIKSPADAIATVLSDYGPGLVFNAESALKILERGPSNLVAAVKSSPRRGPDCPECGDLLIAGEGCYNCLGCGFSRC